jgi:hypothetical protein
MPTDPEDADATRLHDSPLVRGLLLAAGAVAVVLGLVGVVVPVLPTTPFLLVAAACFARASPACYRYLLASRFGPLILEWRQHRSIPWRAKRAALVLLALSLGTSIVLFVRPLWAQLLVAAFGIAVGAWLYRIPSRDR